MGAAEYWESQLPLLKLSNSSQVTGQETYQHQKRGKTSTRRRRDGGAEGARTPDLLNAIQALYQLSYDPIRSAANVGSLGCFVKNIIPRVATGAGNIRWVYDQWCEFNRLAVRDNSVVCLLTANRPL